ncbi:MAG: ABC transporter ATP-binding protein [Actinobacteria bacterium]|nr:ABC transporter ATP-binding protein [Actinomycetota bacterium]
MNVLEVEGLQTQIQLRTRVVKAVDGVSFSIGAGETVGVVGESGSGKSMTAMSILRLLPHGGHVVGGSVRLGGRELTKMAEAELRAVRGNEIGTIFQDPMTSLNPTMTIGRQIAEAVVEHKGVSKRAALDRAAEVLALVGMPNPKERLGDYPHQLSGGLRQRVMIAMALSCEPKLLIADEPTTALDVTIQAQILSLLDDLRARLGMAVLLITHDMGVIAGHSDRTIVMYAGQVVESATTEELFSDVRHPYTEALLASIPQIDQDKAQRLYAIPGLPPDLSRPFVACRFAPRCRYATDRCRQEAPALEGDTHLFACFHPVHESEEELEEQLQSGQSPLAALGRVDGPDLLVGESPVDGAAQGHGAGAPMILHLEGVRKEYPVTAGMLQRKVGSVQAVRGIDLDVAQAETLGIVGESGCGKSTLGRLIVDLEPPSAGRVVFAGRDLTKMHGAELRRAHRDLQLMFQDPYSSLDPRMRVGSIVREPLIVQGIGTPREQHERVGELLREVGLPAHAVDLYPHEFSGGQRQRIGLARALALQPRLIVADEPVSALDVSIRSQILNLMKRLQVAHQLTYVFISHDLSVVRYLADRIAVMYLGKLVEIGTGDDIYSRPAHPYTAGLIGSIPIPNPKVQRGRERNPVRGELPSSLNPPSGCPFRTRCPYAQAQCAQVEPALTPFGGQHFAACHFPLQDPEPRGAETVTVA